DNFANGAWAGPSAQGVHATVIFAFCKVTSVAQGARNPCLGRIAPEAHGSTEQAREPLCHGDHRRCSKPVTTSALLQTHRRSLCLDQNNGRASPMFPLSVLENMQPAENIQQFWDLTSLTEARYQNYRQQAGGILSWKNLGTNSGMN